MNAANMLSANKVKLHGMTSTKWTTKDKITQYKGLIKLYTRDRKIISMDTGVAAKRQSHDLKKLQKEIEQDRKDLDNAISGDKQKLRNTLAEHREMQLAYQYSQPQKVIEMVEQVNFNKRKSRDLLLYKKKQVTEELISLKLKHAELEDVLKMEEFSWQSTFPAEGMSQIITGKVQDAILKKEAAIVIRHSYKEMIAIMKKDALYFDAILEAIKNDSLNQGKCMINATKLGQLATEYLDDRRHEFKQLEKVVKSSLLKRREDLENVKHNVEDFSANVKNLVRRDSDVNVGKVLIQPSESYENLTSEMKNVEHLLKYLRNAIFVPNLESIYPCIQEQGRQKERLTELVQKCEANRNEMLKRLNHSSLMKSEMENTMIETTFEYKQQKKDYLEEIDSQNQRKLELETLVNNRYGLLAKIRIALKHLQLLAELVGAGPVIKTSSSHARSVMKSEIEKPFVDEIDATKIIPELLKQFSKLAQSTKELLKGTERDEGYKMFEVMMHDTTQIVSEDLVISEESLVETEFFSDPNILTRADIKKQSEEIVLANIVTDDMIPDIKPKKKF